MTSHATARSRALQLTAGRRSRSLRWPLAILLCLWLFSITLSAQEMRPTEHQVKAAYLFNFGKFVKWPDQSASSQQATFDLCVIGRDPFGPVLDATVAGESVEGKRVVIRRLPDAQGTSRCRIAFLSSSEEYRMGPMLAALQKAGALTVSDIRRFAQRGGMIEFVVEEGRVRFEVNLARAEDAGLSLSSDLLRVASKVRGKDQRGD